MTPEARRPRKLKQEALTRRLATLSLVLAAGPLTLAVVAAAHYLRKPPPLSGFEGVGWFFGMMAVLSLLVIATYALAPVSILCGLGALARLRLLHAQDARPARAGRRRAAVGVVLSALALAAVATGHVRYRRAEARAEAAERPRLEEVARRRAPEQRAERLVAACREYAVYHDDRFPPDLHELRLWCGRTGRWDEALRSDEFAYLGAGAAARDETGSGPGAGGGTDRPQSNQPRRLLLFVQRQPSPDGLRVIGFAGGSPYAACATTIPEGELGTYLRLSNDERRRQGVAPVEFPPADAPTPTGPVSDTP